MADAVFAAARNPSLEADDLGDEPIILRQGDLSRVEQRPGHRCRAAYPRSWVRRPREQPTKVIKCDSAVTPGAQPSYPRPSLVTTDGRQKPHACVSHTRGVDAGEFSAHQEERGGVVDPDQQESIGFSGEVAPPLDGHKIEIGSMVALRCKRGETHLSHLV